MTRAVFVVALLILAWGVVMAWPLVGISGGQTQPDTSPRSQLITSSSPPQSATLDSRVNRALIEEQVSDGLHASFAERDQAAEGHRKVVDDLFHGLAGESPTAGN
jgi:hypothetical protein